MVTINLKPKLKLFGRTMNKVYLIDIDGTICEDIRNEESHLYPFAEHYEESRQILNKWYDEGNIITFKLDPPCGLTTDPLSSSNTAL